MIELVNQPIVRPSNTGGKAFEDYFCSVGNSWMDEPKVVHFFAYVIKPLPMQIHVDQ